MEDETTTADIVRRLDAIIHLMVTNEKPETLREKICLLHNMGLRNQEVARALNITDKHVGKELSLAKKAGGKKNGK